MQLNNSSLSIIVKSKTLGSMQVDSVETGPLGELVLTVSHANASAEEVGSVERNGSQSLQQREEMLTKREKECLYYTVKGYTAKDTANALGISRRTVEAHLKNLKSKLSVKKKSQLIRFALENQVVI